MIHALSLVARLPTELLGRATNVVLEVFAEERLRRKVEASSDLLDTEIWHLQQSLRFGNYFLHDPLTG